MNDPRGGAPPTFGGLSRYHSASTALTTAPRPWSRDHSAARDASEVPKDGLKSAEMKLIDSQLKASSNVSSTPAVILRRNVRRVRRDRSTSSRTCDDLCAPSGGLSEGACRFAGPDVEIGRGVGDPSVIACPVPTLHRRHLRLG